MARHVRPAHRRSCRLGRRLRRRAHRGRQHARPVPRPGASSPRSTPTSRSRTPSTSRLRLVRAARVRPRRDRRAGRTTRRAQRVVVYTWNFHPDLIESARSQGAHGYLSKTLPARELVAALEAVHAGEIVISDPPPTNRRAAGLDWPGRAEGLTDRESEILALITQGKSNAEVAAADLPQPEHRQVLHPHHLPQDRRRQPHPGRALGRRPRLHPRPPPHRPLARSNLKPQASGFAHIGAGRRRRADLRHRPVVRDLRRPTRAHHRRRAQARVGPPRRRQRHEHPTTSRPECGWTAATSGPVVRAEVGVACLGQVGSDVQTASRDASSGVHPGTPGRNESTWRHSTVAKARPKPRRTDSYAQQGQLMPCARIDGDARARAAGSQDGRGESQARSERRMRACGSRRIGAARVPIRACATGRAAA